MEIDFLVTRITPDYCNGILIIRDAFSGIPRQLTLQVLDCWHHLDDHSVLHRLFWVPWEEPIKATTIVARPPEWCNIHATQLQGYAKKVCGSTGTEGLILAETSIVGTHTRTSRIIRRWDNQISWPYPIPFGTCGPRPKNFWSADERARLNAGRMS